MPNILASEIKAAQTTLLTAEESSDFIPLMVNNLVADQKVDFNVYLKIKKPQGDDFQYVICCPKGEVFPLQWIEKLKASRITGAYFNRSDYPLVLDYCSQNLNLVLKDQNIPLRGKITILHDATLLWVRYFCIEEQARSSNQIKLGLFFINHLLDQLHDPNYHRDWLLEICRHENSLYTHSLNTCLLSLAFTNFMKWPKIRIQNFGLGALLHDVGMTKITPEVLQKHETLTEEERSLINKHTIYGFNLLKDFPLIWSEALLMVHQHHEHCNGSGYPEGLTESAIHPWAHILHIIDGYEALTAQRSWRHSYTPLEALKIMREEWEATKKYNGTYLANFIKYLSSSM
jgi:HD-GYP domain-containing protein (c-di-GMP phosphodiesterase class II)